MTLDDLQAITGQEIHVTEWLAVTQDRIDLFAEATEDPQWIHIDQDRAQRESPYGTTISHGFLTLSMLSHLSRNVLSIDDRRMRVNYGLNRVRFPAAVREGSKIRGRFTLQSVKPFGEGSDLTFAVIIELAGSEKPCCVAEWIVRYYAAR